MIQTGDPITTIRPWGNFRTYADNEPCTVKLLTIEPGQALSLQYHNQRAQRYIIIDRIYIEWADSPLPDGMGNDEAKDWFRQHRRASMCYMGDELLFGERVIHRPSNHGDKPVRFAEVAYGINDEDDIVRLDDRYGRAE